MYGILQPRFRGAAVLNGIGHEQRIVKDTGEWTPLSQETQENMSGSRANERSVLPVAHLNTQTFSTFPPRLPDAPNALLS
jgi:hypothetical protein